MPRRTAHRVLWRIAHEGAYSHIALDAELTRSSLDARDRALATELVYGTLTWQGALDTLLARATKRPLHLLDVEALIAMRVALYQMVFLDRIPTRAAVDEAVTLTRQALDPRVANFVNGVLRGLGRAQEQGELRWYEPTDRERKPARYIAQRYALPGWIANRLIQQHGLHDAELIAKAYTTRASLHLRAASSPDDTCEPVDGVPRAWRASQGMTQPLRDALGSGLAHVQDLGSQLIGLMVAPKPGHRVLDACAGLGGKSLHLASMLGIAGEVVAVEPLPQKLAMLQDAARRSGVEDIITAHQAKLQEFVATQPPASFDRVIVDAPCSGLGVMRRHPETRWRRQEADIGPLASLQAELLAQAATQVKPGGALVYSVCTFLREEGSRQVERFLEAHPDFALDAPPEAADVDWARFAPQGVLQLDPHQHDSDGFYAARLIRAQPSPSPTPTEDAP